MTKDEELEYLRQENAALREELWQVREQLKAVQDQQAKDSHNSSLPPHRTASCAARRACGRRAGTSQEGNRDILVTI